MVRYLFYTIGDLTYQSPLVREIGFDVLALFGIMLKLYQNALPPPPHKMKSERIGALRNYTLAVIRFVLRRCGVAVTLYTRHGVERDVWDRNDLQEGHRYVMARIVTPAGQYSHALLFRRKVSLLVNSVRTCLIVGSEGSHLKE